MSNKYWKNRSILITGGSGFIGSHLLKELISLGANVMVYDISPTQISTINTKYSYVQKDLSCIDWDAEVSSYDVIFHLAGSAFVTYSVEKPDVDFDTNLLVSFKLLDALRINRWKGTLIFPSSAAVYGNPVLIPITEDTPTIPISPYGVAKLAIERYIDVYCRLYGLKAASVRPFSVYGPGQQKLVIYDMIQKILNSPDEIEIYGNGSQTRDFLFISDLIEALLLVVEKGALRGEVYNVASGQERSILNVVDTICRLLEIHPNYLFSGSVRPGEPERWSVDIGKLKQLGFSPKVIFEEGISDVIQWCVNERNILI
jgi:UDP-glucose 4-epimerase